MLRTLHPEPEGGGVVQFSPAPFFMGLVTKGMVTKGMVTKGAWVTYTLNPKVAVWCSLVLLHFSWAWCSCVAAKSLRRLLSIKSTRTRQDRPTRQSRQGLRARGVWWGAYARSMAPNS